MKNSKITTEDPLLKIDTDFVKAHHNIKGFDFDNIKAIGIHAIPVKKELNDKEEAKFGKLPIDTI